MRTVLLLTLRIYSIYSKFDAYDLPSVVTEDSPCLEYLKNRC